LARWPRPPPAGLLVARVGGQDGGGELAAAGREGDGDAMGDGDAVFRFLAEEAGLGRAGALKAMDRYAPLRNYSVEGKLAPNRKFLVEGAGLGKEGAAVAITGHPEVLGYSKKNIAPKVRYLVVRYLAEDLGLGRAGATKLITRFPSVLGFSVDDNLAPKVRYLEEELGLGRDGAAKLITQCPPVLGLSVEDNIAPKLRFLAEEVGAGREGAADIILAHSTMLGYSIERKLRPTLRFLVENFPHTPAAKMVWLSVYSLAGRLVPRVRLLQKHDQTGRFAASSMAVLTPADFCEKVGVTMDEYDAEVAACKMEYAEKHPSLEAGGRGGGGGGGRNGRRRGRGRR